MFQKCTFLFHEFIIFMRDSQYSRRVKKIFVHKFCGDNSVEQPSKTVDSTPCVCMHGQ